MVVLDSTIVNVALPDIQADLGFSPAGLTWVVNAYLVTFGSFLLVAGRFGDLIGRRRVFLAGVVLFTLASVAVRLRRPARRMLIAARFLQGIGGAIASSVTIALIVSEFPGTRDRAKAMSVYMFVGGRAAARRACSLGGLLTDVARLALDLLHQPADRPRHAAARPRVHRRERGDRARRRRRRARRDAGDGRADARRLRDRRLGRPRLGLGAHARLGRRRPRAADRVRRARGAHANPIMPLADLPRAGPRRLARSCAAS